MVGLRPPTVSSYFDRKRVSSWNNPATEPWWMSPRLSETMNVDPSSTWTASGSSSGGLSLGIRPGARQRRQIRQSPLGLLHQSLVPDRPGLIPGPGQQFPCLMGPGGGLLLGGVLDRLVGLDDQLEDLIGLHSILTSP